MEVFIYHKIFYAEALKYCLYAILRLFSKIGDVGVSTNIKNLEGLKTWFLDPLWLLARGCAI